MIFGFMKMIKVTCVFLLCFFGNFAYANGGLKFDWGGKSVIVTEKRYKDNDVVSFQYKVTLNEVDEGYIVHQSDLEILAVNGKGITPEFRDKVAPMSVAAAMPDILVDKDGNPIKVLDFENYLSKLAASIPDPRYGKVINTPQMKQLLYEKTFENWCYWVCSWVDPRISEHEPFLEDYEIEMAGIKLPSTSSIELEKNYKNTNYDRLVLKTATRGEVVAEAFIEFMKELASQVNKPTNFSAPEKDAIDEFERLGVVTAIVTPMTLQPISVIVEGSSAIKSQDELFKKYQKTEFSFIWF
jgi:hypothetical protein